MPGGIENYGTLPNSYLRYGSGNNITKIRFQHMPKDLSEQKSVNWTTTDIIGRSEPRRQYSNSGPRSLNLNLDFHASIKQGDNGTAKDLDTKIRNLRSLAYPRYGVGPIRNPHAVRLKLGDWLMMRAVVTDINVSYPGPFEVETLRPMFAQVALSLEEWNHIPYSNVEIIAGEDLKENRSVESQVGDFFDRADFGLNLFGFSFEGI